jgi:hypothetical protein
MKAKLPEKITIPDLHGEINRLRRRDGLEAVGGLGLAHKLFTHFHEANNPRVAEALRNLESQAPPVRCAPE